MIFDSEESLLLEVDVNCVRVVYATLKDDCCYLIVSHKQRFYSTFFGKMVVDRIFARSLLMASPENKEDFIFDVFARTLLIEFYRIT